MARYKKILIVQTAFIGDVILITSLIRETKKLFPEAEIDILVIPSTASILANNPYLHKIVVFDKKKKKIPSFLKAMREIRSKNYDLALIPHSSFTTAFLVFMSGIRERIGFTRKLRALFLTKKILPPKNIHRLERNLSLLQPFGLYDKDIRTELYPTDIDRKKADSIKLPENKLLISVAPGSVWKTKCWPEEYYSELMNSLKDVADFLMIGSKQEEELCRNILTTSGSTGINYAGKTSILESAALIEKSDLLLCNDSGAMHIANAMKTRVIAFFGPTVRDFGFYPYRDEDYICEVDLDCRPCHHHGPVRCPLGHHNCMRMIKPESIKNIILSLL